MTSLFMNSICRKEFQHQYTTSLWPTGTLEQTTRQTTGQHMYLKEFPATAPNPSIQGKHYTANAGLAHEFTKCLQIKEWRFWTWTCQRHNTSKKSCWTYFLRPDFVPSPPSWKATPASPSVLGSDASKPPLPASPAFNTERQITNMNCPMHSRVQSTRSKMKSYKTSCVA